MNIRMSTKGKRPLRSLTPSDKVHAIQRIHDGESKASVARDIGVPESTLRGWCKNEDKLRFMSRQSAAEKMGGEALSDKLDGSSNLLGGPPEKRQRLDPSMPLNFSNKMKFDELAAFKRAPLTGLDFGANKTLTDLSAFNGLTADYGAFNGSAKNKVFGADISRPTDPSMAAISPLSSLSHLSGLTGLSQSPLAMSFNELTSNLNLLAQLNPGLAAMSGLNGLAATNNSLRNNNPKSKPPVHSPRSETAERQTGLSVKNWAKQKPSTPTANDSSAFGLNLSQNETKGQLKNSTNSLMPPQLGVNLPPLPALPEDPLLYWLKSQQAMLGLNNLYPPPPPPLGATSPPIRSSTPQQQSLHASTPPIIPTPLTPSSTPSGSLDDKNSAWFNWCKAFGASLNSLAPAAAAAALHGNPLQHAPTPGNTGETPAIGDSQSVGKTGFENILYSQLTKDSAPSPSVQSSSSIEQISNEMSHNVDMSNKPEDLSSKSTKARSPPISPLPTPAQSPERNIDQSDEHNNSLTPSPIAIGSDGDLLDSEQHHNTTRNSVADCRDVLDNLLYKINNNNGQNNRHVSESEASYNSDHQHHNIDDCTHNNNNNSNKTDEEERAKCSELYVNDEAVADCREAIEHGEKFLQWLENFSNPRVTAVQLMQLRFLISSVKSDLDPKSNLKEATSPTNLSTAIEIDDSSEECNRLKIRRRK